MNNINFNININLRNLENLEKILDLLNKNKEKKEKISTENNNKFCLKCGNKKRFVENRNGKFKSFFCCDVCNPRKTNFSDNISTTPNTINCPHCSNLINEKKSKYGTYFTCDCGFKIDTRNENFKNLIKK